MNDQQLFHSAEERYSELGVEVQSGLERLAKLDLSIHCWQADDVGGFETPDAKLAGGGIQVTGNYPGKARSLEELRADLQTVFALLPGKHRLALHASYGDFAGKKIDRDQVAPEHFQSWAEWASTHGISLDFNSTFFSHPLADSGFTLSSKNHEVRSFWICHAQACREIGAFLGERQGNPCIHNLWIPDGAKDHTVDRFGYRRLLAESLDAIYERDYDPGCLKDSLESKLFGIGSEAFVVGSHEFYLGYALSRGKLICLDSGHFHPTESIADKVSALFQFVEELVFHVSRPMRWDSDHVVILSDELRELCAELVRSGKLERCHVGLDFFDATLNRIGSYAIGARATLKAFLMALLLPHERLRRYEESGDFFARLGLLEEMKGLPFGAVWDEHCRRMNAPLDRELIERVQRYERDVTGRRQ
ncbi:MAG: L-rhamnose isomerase [Spirochaetaceae bacterium]|nr:MAG: L-rhamnose isomerase [Spirochaetaceae bacterium]